MNSGAGVFESGRPRSFERFSGSLNFDRRLLTDIRGSQAFARALERVGILTAEERARIVAAFDEIRQEPVDSQRSDEDIPYVIRKLKEHAGR